MIVSLDTETQGLNGKMISCCIYKSKNVHYICNTQKEAWDKLIQLSRKEAKRGKILYVYAHNMSFDFYKITDWEKSGVKIYNTLPFIGEYTFKDNKSKRFGNNYKKATIKFLCTWGLMRQSLKKCAELIGMKKLQISDELLSDNTNKTKLSKEEEAYMIRDAEICKAIVDNIKLENKKYNIKLKQIISIGNCAINTFLKFCKDINYDEIFKDKFKNSIIQPEYLNEIHKAYRYGRIELKRTKLDSNVFEVDVNNLYSYSAMSNPFPDLKSERMISNPLEYLSDKGLRKLLEQYPIGVSKVVIETPRESSIAHTYGFIVTRTKDSRYFPNKPGKIICGSYTNVELVKALQLGYKILDCDYVITFKESQINPFKEFFQEIYNRRKSGNKFSDYYWKQIANNLIGKFAQIRPKKEYIVDDIMKAEQYYQNGYRFIKSHKDKYLYYKEYEPKPSKYYNVIISAMTNAYAKIYHYDFLTKIPKNDFVYCDTDNIIFKNADNLKHFPINDKIGGFKVSKYNQSFHAYNKKTYRIGTDIRASGARKPTNSVELKMMLDDFENGYIHYQRMNGIGKGHDLSESGNFNRVSVNLLNSMIKGVNKEDKLEEQRLYIDAMEKFDPERLAGVLG